jgi:hypothetical protein
MKLLVEEDKKYKKKNTKKIVKRGERSASSYHDETPSCHDGYVHKL